MVFCELGTEQLRGRSSSENSENSEKLVNMSMHLGSTVVSTVVTQRGR